MTRHPEREPIPTTAIDEIEWIGALRLDQTDRLNRDAIRRLYHEHWEHVSTAPGSSHNHQAWSGGYLEHIRQVNMYVAHLYELWVSLGLFESIPPQERFDVSEALTVTTLHDIEKPFRWLTDSDGQLLAHPDLVSKQQRTNFRDTVLARYGIVLNPMQQNAMLYVEGFGDDYSPTQRIMLPMAVLCHTADLLSARGSYQLRPSHTAQTTHLNRP